MKKLSIVCLALVMTVAFGFGSAFAASAKVTAQRGDLSLVPATNEWTPVFSQDIHVPSQKDLFIDVSLECGLTTNTKVMSKALKRAISQSEAEVKVRVLVNDALAEPGEITFARRYQALIAEFAGSFMLDPENCTGDYAYIDTWQECFVVEDGITTIADCCLTEEMLALILDTMTANSFNFIVDDLESGDYTVVVEAKLRFRTEGGEYVAEESDGLWYEDIATNAYLGHGTVTIECVRMIKDEDLDPPEL